MTTPHHENLSEDTVRTVEETDSPLQPGRPVVLVPTPPGFWALLLGVAVAALAPLFGFLWGGARGPGEGDADFNPIYLGLFFGILVGAAGVVLALMGGVRLYRHSHASAEVAERSVGAEGAERSV